MISASVNPTKNLNSVWSVSTSDKTFGSRAEIEAAVLAGEVPLQRDRVRVSHTRDASQEDLQKAERLRAAAKARERDAKPSNRKATAWVLGSLALGVMGIAACSYFLGTEFAVGAPPVLTRLAFMAPAAATSLQGLKSSFVSINYNLRAIDNEQKAEELSTRREVEFGYLSPVNQGTLTEPKMGLDYRRGVKGIASYRLTS